MIFRHSFPSTGLQIDVQIINDLDFAKNHRFEIEQYDPTGGATIGRNKRTTVTLMKDDDSNPMMMNRVMAMTRERMAKLKVARETWSARIKEAVTVNGGDLENATSMDYIMHILTFGWKVIFCLVPPEDIWGGWLTFFVSLLFIAIMTTIVGDCAAIFGCLVGLNEEVTGITLVALGTSLPDAFASKAAAVKEKYADMAIGNVTGGNSVNVFLGLGFPWLLAAIYHSSKGNKFQVPSGSWGFVVTIFAICAVFTIGLFYARRYMAIFGKAELGGPTLPKYISGIFIFSLWIAFILLAALQNYGIIGGF